ncbi:hypothetical protein [Flavobacterium sp.]|jgi:hypothetical protein|uniref:hypothetical protein n=1 Tax=Flavobacterium sp. TaxID=239 RepID=UPI0022C09FBF|nr:hypothetical protein [Flavobacterium sp.]MCZ8144481.1 hypothetical protein [Flavobacterium sp.]MCZ8365859.1 hypothetical protein [Flavobacterium sp.]
MSLTLSKNKILQFLFILCVAVPYFNNYELTFFIWFLTVSLTLRTNYSINIINQILCFLGIIIISLVSSFFYEFTVYNFIRDFTYLLKPIFGLLLGYQICKRYSNNNPLYLIIRTGVFLAILHLIIVAFSFIFLTVRDINGLRYYAGYFSDFEVYGLVFLFFSKQLGIEISESKRKKYILLLAVSSMFYLSRTNFIQFVLMFMALKGYFTINKRAITVLATFAVATILLYSAILYVNPKRNGPGIEAFLYKVKIAPTEPFKTKINKEDYKDFNDNYRSLENILTINQMTAEDKSTIIFGKGMGSEVKLHAEVMLDGVVFSKISILHNGFMTIFLKSGLLGVVLLILSIVLLYRNCFYQNPMFKNINYFFIGTILFLFISYWVFMGFYFKADTKSILIGLMIAYVENKRRQLKDKKILSQDI